MQDFSLWFVAYCYHKITTMKEDWYISFDVFTTIKYAVVAAQILVK